MNHNVDIDHVPVFKFMPTGAIKSLEPHFQILSLEKEQRLLAFGQKVDHLYLVIKGSVNVYGQDQQTCICSLGPGSSVGEMTLIEPDAKSSACILAGPDGVTLGACPQPIFQESILAHPHLAYCFYQGVATVLADRVRSTNEKAQLSLDGGVKLVKGMLSHYQMDQKFTQVKGRIENLGGQVVSSLADVVEALEKIIAAADGPNRDDLIPLRDQLQQVMLEDMQDVDRISQQLSLLMQYLSNVKRAMAGESLIPITGDQNLL